MPRYLVTTRRTERDAAMSARDAVMAEPGVKLVSSNDPNMVTIEAGEDAASRLRTKLQGSHFVEPEIRRGLT
jgi:hypothetical protein